MATTSLNFPAILYNSTFATMIIIIAFTLLLQSLAVERILNQCKTSSTPPIDTSVLDWSNKILLATSIALISISVMSLVNSRDVVFARYYYNLTLALSFIIIIIGFIFMFNKPNCSDKNLRIDSLLTLGPGALIVILTFTSYIVNLGCSAQKNRLGLPTNTLTKLVQNLLSYN